MKYLSLFSGIGGFELGIKQAYEKNKRLGQQERQNNTVSGRQEEKHSPGVGNTQIKWNPNDTKYSSHPTCIGYSEVDKYAIQIYEKHFPEHKNYGDITKIDPEDLPEFDLLVGGFPCQAFSIAGNRGGFDDTRGTLFFDIARIAQQRQPRLLVLENVKGLLSHDKGRTFNTIITTLDELGYDLQWQVLNSKYHGVPQNRERVFIVGHLRGTPRPKVFPIGSTTETALGDCKISNTSKLAQLNQPKHSNDRVYGTDGVSPTLNTAQGGRRQPFVAMQWRRTEKGKKARRENQKDGKDYTPFSEGHREIVPKENKPVGALTAQAIAKDSLIGSIDKTKIRRLTPTECERLQGFPENWTEGLSDTQRYKTLGNAVTVNVIESIFDNLTT